MQQVLSELYAQHLPHSIEDILAEEIVSHRGIQCHWKTVNGEVQYPREFRYLATAAKI